ncbi:hypothetical protein [Sorangium sp. So ce1151]|uniref:hypothetical protein n=1 Tax=Sorangium sp. So ce1151 TaxID=3133332 RepID=UPI003F6031D0
MEPLFVLMIISGIAGLARCIAQASQEARRAAEARWRMARPVWQRAAALVGGQFKSGPGQWGDPRMQISVVFDNVALLVDHDIAQGDAAVVRYHTRITGTARNPSGLRLRVNEQRLRSSRSDGSFRARQVDVGDPAQDGAFVVKASNPTLARWWLTPPLREALRAAADYQLTLESHRLTAMRAGLEDDAEKLASAIRAAALVAGRGRALTRELRALAQELGGRLLSAGAASSEGEMTIELEHRGRLLTVELGRRGKKGPFCTQVRVPRAASPSERFALRCRPRRGPARKAPGPSGDDALARAYAIQADAPDRVAQRLGDELRREIAALRPAAILGDEAAVTLVFGQLETGRDRIERAIAIASALAAPAPHGPYR